MERLEIGIDGNCIYVGLGILPEPESKFHFMDIDNAETAPSLNVQRLQAYNEWCEKFPEEGRLPFDIVRTS